MTMKTPTDNHILLNIHTNDYLLLDTQDLSNLTILLKKARIVEIGYDDTIKDITPVTPKTLSISFVSKSIINKFLEEEKAKKPETKE